MYIAKRRQILCASNDTCRNTRKKQRLDECEGNYDFIKDVESEKVEVRYAGVKALGFLPSNQNYIVKLKKILAVEEDKRIKLEIFSSLIRLGEDVWDDLDNYAMSLDENEYRLEYVLILSELNQYAAAEKRLLDMADDDSLEPELRAAAAWGVCVSESSLPRLVQIANSEDTNVSAHALAHIIENFKEEYTSTLFSLIENDTMGGIVLKILTNVDMNRENFIAMCMENKSAKVQKKWGVLTIGMMGREYFDGLTEEIRKLGDIEYFTIKELWDYKKSAVDDDKSTRIEFLRKQNL